MAVYTLQAPMPELDVASGMQLRLEAIDPATGAAVADVVATAWAIYGYDLSGTPGGLGDLVPRYLPEEVPGVEV